MSNAPDTTASSESHGGDSGGGHRDGLLPGLLHSQPQQPTAPQQQQQQHHLGNVPGGSGGAPQAPTSPGRATSPGTVSPTRAHTHVSPAAAARQQQQNGGTAFPHVVRPVPVFVADRALQSRQTARAAARTAHGSVSSEDISSDDDGGGDGDGAALPQLVSPNYAFPAAGEHHGSPAGAGSQGLLHPHAAAGKGPYAVRTPSRLGNSVTSVDQIDRSAAGSPISAAQLSNAFNRNSNSGATNTNINTHHNISNGYSGPPGGAEISTGGLHMDPTTAARVVSEFHRQQQLQTYQQQQEQLRQKIAAYRGQLQASSAAGNAAGGAAAGEEREALRRAQSELTDVIALEKKMLASGANHWTPFVATTMRPEVFERSARIDVRELNRQNNLEGAWGGGDMDPAGHAHNIPMRGIFMIKNFVCCFIPGGAMFEDLEGDNNKPKRHYEEEGYRNYLDARGGYKSHGDSARATSSDGTLGDGRHSKEDGRSRYHHYSRQNMRSYVEKKKKKWLPKIFYVLLSGSLIPLLLRLFNIIFSAIGLGLACSVFTKSHHTAVPQQASTIMAIVVQTCALVYLMYIAYDEYASKPLGLRDLREKMRLIMLDLLFIIFSSANLSLAFQSLFDSMWVCQTNVSLDAQYTGSKDPTPYNAAVCKRQRALVSFELVILVSWVLTFTVSMFRLMDRMTSRPR